MMPKCEKCNENRATGFYRTKPLCAKCYRENLEKDKNKRRIILNEKNKRQSFGM